MSAISEDQRMNTYELYFDTEVARNTHGFKTHYTRSTKKLITAETVVDAFRNSRQTYKGRGRLIQINLQNKTNQFRRGNVLYSQTFGFHEHECPSWPDKKKITDYSDISMEEIETLIIMKGEKYINYTTDNISSFAFIDGEFVKINKNMASRIYFNQNGTKKISWVFQKNMIKDVYAMYNIDVKDKPSLL